MHNTQAKIEQVRDLAAQVDPADRLAMIRAIAALESRPDLAEADEFSGALAVEQENWFTVHNWNREMAHLYRSDLIPPIPVLPVVLYHEESGVGSAEISALDMLARRPRRLPSLV